MNPSTIALLLVLAAPGQAGSAADPPGANARLSGLPRRVVHDLARLGTMPSIAVLGAGGAAAAAVHPADDALTPSSSSSPALHAGATVGGTPVQFGIAAAVYGVGLAVHRAGAAEFGSALLEGQIVQSVLSQGIKHAVGRTRPDGGHNSFPSGHTASTFVTADAVLRRFGWRAGAAAYAAAVYVGASRVAERQHYLSDVVFGAAVGIASERTVRMTVGHAAVSASATPLPGGGAVVFVVGVRD
jgi:hypothetical protein